MSKQYRGEDSLAQSGGYNFAIPNIISNSASRAHRPAHRTWIVICIFVMGAMAVVQAQDWSIPEQQLAKQIVDVTGAGPASFTFENRSSLGRRDSEIIQNGLRSALANAGIRSSQSSSGMTAVTITLSENANNYIWVAQIATGQGQSSVVMVSVPKPIETAGNRESVPLTLRKISLWEQPTSMLDVLVLEENTTSNRIAVLEPERVVLYRLQGGKSEIEQSLITHTNAWPRDLRGRLVPGSDHLLDVYLPGVSCRSNTAPPFSLSCHASDEPWPLIVNRSVISARATFVASRNFFAGTFTPAVGKFSSATPFYSTAMLTHDNSELWFLSGTDRRIHILDGVSDRITAADWGSDIAGVHTSCAAGWQLLATSSGLDDSDSVRAYEIPDRDPVAVSAAVDLSGEVSALWTEPRGDTGVVIVRNQGTGTYEAFRLAMACGQ